MEPDKIPPCRSPAEPHRRDAGFSVMEIVMVMIIGITVTASAVPIISNVLSYYRLRSAISTATWAVQSVRFQALEKGYPFQVAFSGGTGGINPSYQISSEPIGATSFSNVGSSVPLSGAPVVLGSSITFQFKGNGVVSTSPVSTAPYTFTLSYSGTTETITVSNYGNVDVSP
jgi:Tfp pilus assembly protein FimT